MKKGQHAFVNEWSLQIITHNEKDENYLYNAGLPMRFYRCDSSHMELLCNDNEKYFCFNQIFNKNTNTSCNGIGRLQALH